MTLDQFGTIINSLGLLVPLLFSLSIARAYSRPYFRSWTFSYLFFTTAILVLNFSPPALIHGPAAMALVVVYQAGTWSLLRTADQLRPDRRLSRLHAGFGGVTLAIALVMVAFDQPFSSALLCPVLFVVWIHLVLAREVWRLPTRLPRGDQRWLAVLIAATGLWVLAYPVYGDTPLAWVGYFVSGALHLFVGVQMVIYLLQDVAATLATQNEALQQVDRLKTNFISTVSHELRTPVTAIKSAAFLLDSSKVSPGELKGIIAQQTDALSRIVSDMLDVSLIESGAMTYQPTAIDLVELIDEAVASFTHLFDHKGVVLAFESGLERLSVSADADRLKQVMANLLTNALKFTPEGGRVTVRVSVADGHATVEVADTGVGVPEPHRTRIFERFYQVDNSSTRKVGGAGLGLAISKAIVEDGHGGRIWVDNHYTEGSRFVFTVPRDVTTGAARSA